MLKVKKYLFVIFLLIISEISDLNCSLSLPGSINDNKYIISVGYTTERKSVKINSNSTDLIVLDINGTIFKYFDRTYKDYNIDILSNYTFLSFSIKPFYKIWYNASFDLIGAQTGKLGDKNFLSSLTYGYGGNLSLFYNLFPQTIVTPAIIAKVNVEVREYRFDSFFDNNYIKYKVESNIFINDSSFGLYGVRTIAKQFLEVYVGSDIIYRSSSLNDITSSLSVSGSETFLKFYLNNKFYITKNEKLEIYFEYTTKKEYTFSIAYEIGW